MGIIILVSGYLYKDVCHNAVSNSGNIGDSLNVLVKLLNNIMLKPFNGIPCSYKMMLLVYVHKDVHYKSFMKKQIPKELCRVF